MSETSRIKDFKENHLIPPHVSLPVVSVSLRVPQSREANVAIKKWLVTTSQALAFKSHPQMLTVRYPHST